MGRARCAPRRCKARDECDRLTRSNDCRVQCGQTKGEDRKALPQDSTWMEGRSAPGSPALARALCNRRSPAYVRRSLENSIYGEGYSLFLRIMVPAPNAVRML